METGTEIASRRGELSDDGGRTLRWRVDAPAAGASATGAEPRPCVVIAHGFKGFMDWGFFPELARRIAASGRVALSFNFSGSGIGSDPEVFSEHDAFERNTYSHELEDLATMASFARQLPEVDAARCGLLGHSRGGGMALVHAAERAGTDALVVWAPISRVDRFDARTVQAWRERGYLTIPNARTGQEHRLGLDVIDDVEANRARFDIHAACARIQAPTCIVHGTHDETVPLAEGQSLYEALPPGLGELVRVEGAGHTFGARHPSDGVGAELEHALAATLAHFDRYLSIQA